MPHPYKPDFGRALRRCLDSDPHSRPLRQIARLLGRNPGTLRRWLEEERQIPLNDLLRLCRLLELPLGQRARLLDLAGYEVDHTLLGDPVEQTGSQPGRAGRRPGFGEQLRRHIAADPAGRSQRQLAAAIGSRPSLLNHWLAERRQIPYNDLLRLCRALTLTPPQRADLMQRAGYEVALTGISASRSQAPLQRPPRPVHFTGREAEVENLLTQLRPERVVTLCGPGGIGKSALAAEVVWRLTADDRLSPAFPDGIIYHSFYNQPQASLALQQIVLSFGEKPRPTPRDAALRLLANKQALLVLDGTEAADDLPLVLGVRGRCGVLLTTRRRQDAVDAWIDLAPLAPDASAGLLRTWAGQWADDEGVVRQICRLVDGLPLAVRLVGRYLAHNAEPAAGYLAWLTATPLEALDQGQRQLESVPLLLQHSLNQLSQTARLALGCACLLALAPFEGVVIAQALERETVAEPLAELVDYGLLLRVGERYEISHALIHTFGRRRPPPQTVLANLTAIYQQQVETLATQGATGFSRLDRERPHILAVLQNCVTRGDWAATLALALAIQNYLDLRGFWTERIAVLEWGLAAARTLDNTAHEARLLGLLGLAQRDVGNLDQAVACIEQGIAVAQAIEDRRQECVFLGTLGLIYQDRGENALARSCYQQAIALTEHGVERTRLGHQLVGLATNLRVSGQSAPAIDYARQALAVAREVGHQRLVGMGLTILGLTYRHQGQLDLALDYCRQALTIARETGDRRREGAYLSNLGIVYVSAGQVEPALDLFEQALSIAREIEDRREESNHLGRIGFAYCELEQPRRAIAPAEQALLIARQIGDRYRQGNHLGVLAWAQRLAHDPETAIDYGLQALTVVRELDDRRGEAHHQRNLALAFAALGNLGEAHRRMAAALNLFEDLESLWASRVRRELHSL